MPTNRESTNNRQLRQVLEVIIKIIITVIVATMAPQQRLQVPYRVIIMITRVLLIHTIIIVVIILIMEDIMEVVSITGMEARVTWKA